MGHIATRGLPSDACPYPKPFPASFDGCVAYLAADYLAVSEHGKVLTARTCRFLRAEVRPDQPHRFYGRCELGTAEQRRDWSRSVGIELLWRVRRGWEELSVAMRPLMAELLKLRNQQDGSRSGEDDQLAQLLIRWRGELKAFTDEYQPKLDEIGMSPGLCMELANSILEHLFANRPRAGGWEIPTDLLDRLPARSRDFFNPWASRRPNHR